MRVLSSSEPLLVCDAEFPLETRATGMTISDMRPFSISKQTKRSNDKPYRGSERFDAGIYGSSDEPSVLIPGSRLGILRINNVGAGYNLWRSVSFDTHDGPEMQMETLMQTTVSVSRIILPFFGYHIPEL